MDLSTREGRREQGLRIQRALEKAGLSVEELARHIGCSRALIYQYLSGTTLAQPDRLQQIGREAGVPLAYFFGAHDAAAALDGPHNADREDQASRLAERMRRLEDLATAQESPPDWAALASTCEQLFSLAVEADDARAEARALLRLGRARIRSGEFARAADSLQRAVDGFAALHDNGCEADARQALGSALAALGRSDEAREQFTFLARSDRWEARWSGAVSLAALAEQAGDYQRAMACCDEATAIIEESEPNTAGRTGQLYVDANRVNIYLACGDLATAETLIKRCLQEAEALGLSDQHLEARINLGVCALYRGRWVAAHTTLTGALRLARFVGDAGREALARALHAMVLAALGDFDAAIQQAKDALAAALARGDRRAEMFSQLALTDAYLGAERHSEARYHATQALTSATSLLLPLYQVEAQLRLARLHLATAETAEAETQIERAGHEAGRLGARHLEAIAQLLRCDLLLRAGRQQEAHAVAAAACAAAAEMGMVPLEWEAYAMRARAQLEAKPAHTEQAQEDAAHAIGRLDALRVEVRAAGIADTLLEDRRRQDLYLLHARALTRQGRSEEGRAALEQAGWPPLAARVGEISASD